MKIFMKCILVISLMTSTWYFSSIISAEATFEVDITVDQENATRKDSQTNYYSYDRYTSGSNQNQWGYEIAVDADGYICELNTLVSMPVNGFILSTHNDSLKLIFANDLKIGDIVEYANFQAKIVRDDILSSIYCAKTNFSTLESTYASAKKDLLDVDYEGIDSNIEIINKIFEQISDLSVEELLEFNQLIDNTLYMCMPSNIIGGNAIWHRPMATKDLSNTYDECTLEGVTSFLDDLVSSGINTVFLETYRESFLSFPVIYTNSSGKFINLLHGSFSGCNYGEYVNDYTLAFITEAHKRGIEVHAWTETFLAYVEGYVKPSHIEEDWLIEFYDGTKFASSLAFLDPSNDEVIEYLTWIYEQIMNYDFDGIQFDYIRYSDSIYTDSSIVSDPGYNEISADAFMQEYGYSGDLREIITSGNFKNAVREDFNEFRTNNVTNAFKNFRNIIKEIDNEMVISISVGSDPTDAKNILMQDYEGWISYNLVDLVCPMAYVSDVTALKELVTNINKIISNKTFHYTGLAPIYDGYTIKLNQEQIVGVDEVGTDGYSLFASFNYFGSINYESELTLSTNRLDSITPLSDATDIYNIGLSHLKSQIDYIYLYNDVLTDEEAENIKQAIEEIIDCPNFNPLQIQNSIEKLENLKVDVKNYRAEEGINNYIIDLINVLDVKISRQLVNDGYWVSNEIRPTITSDMYDINDDGSSSLPDNESNDDNYNPTIYLVIFTSILCFASITVFYMHKRRKKR